MKPTATSQKLRGGYYTPESIAAFLADWAVRTPEDEVLEPSCGDGVLLQAAARALLVRGATPGAVGHQMCGVELDPREAGKTCAHLRQMGLSMPAPAIRVGDFFAFARDHLARDGRQFNAVIGNPPFVRYQNFSEEQRTIAFDLMNRLGLSPNRLTNIWVPFVAVASLFLKPLGRLAMVVPAELLQVTYTAELRRFLGEHFGRVMLVTFRRLVFPKIQQEVVLLCAEKPGGKRTGINVVELDGLDDLAGSVGELIDPRALKPMDHGTEKWTQYFLSRREIGLVRTLRKDVRLRRLGELASVDVGVVTGLNEFFILDEEARRAAGLNGHTRKIVTRSGHLRGLRFTAADWHALSEGGQRAHLLDAPPRPAAQLPKAVRRHVRRGEELGVHEGYKCRIRKLWYVVPSLWVPDAFLLRQIHRHPRLVINEAQATCTDTIHRVRLLPGNDGRLLTAACFNSLTFAFAEIVGRSYGGGVLELEPREAEQLPIPLDGAERTDFEQIHGLVTANEITTALDVTDQLLLREGLGLAARDVQALRDIWARLRDRRLLRTHRPSPK